MFYNYLKISTRNIFRHKLFSFINISGLVLSITICLSALMIVYNQLNFDDFHPHSQRTYRVISEVVYEKGDTERYATTPLPLGEKLKEYDFVETTVRLNRSIFGKATSAGKKLPVRGSFTDPAFFDVFGFKLESGNPGTALSEPYSVVLSNETAQRFFGDRNPLGETFSVEGIGNFTITGVLQPPEGETHLRLGILASMKTIPLLNDRPSMQNELLNQQWKRSTYAYTYVLLRAGTGKKVLTETLSSQARRITETYKPVSKIKELRFDTQTMNAISPGEELYSDIGAGKARSVLELMMLSGIALVILLMACFNYTNLSIARALSRAREVGIYKTMGAFRHQIMTKFIVQATLIVLLAMVLAYAILPFIPLPRDIMDEVRSVTPGVSLLGWFLLFAVFTGLLAGGFPAWLISSVQPVKMLKNFKNLELIEGLTLRKTLVVAQFTLSLVLIICTAVIYQQSQYVATTDYGFQRENSIDLELQGVDHQLLRDELSGIAGVEEISAKSARFGSFSNGRATLRKKKTDSPIYADSYSVDQNLISNKELTLLAGNNFPEGVSGEQESYIIINESSLSPLGWDNPSEAIGQSLWIDDSLQVEVSGVLKDFHHESMATSISPMLLRYNPGEFRYLNLRLASSKTGDITKKLEAAWEKVAPQIPIQYSYSDKAHYEMHAHERDVAAIGFYALIALTIASLGLLGMVTYTIEVRTREVGIRKILGAGVARIIGLLSKEFVLLLTIAGLIGLPISYGIGLQFLKSYAYHISIGFSTLTFGLSYNANYWTLGNWYSNLENSNRKSR